MKKFMVLAVPLAYDWSKNQFWPIKAYSILEVIFPTLKPRTSFFFVVVLWKTFIFQTQLQLKATDT